ncbi:MAG TPA: class I SAM-dependent methyltransferase [Baekduia sp.]|nr:class I SAM-dependent methyltransferase [Baekduia sp.]
MPQLYLHSMANFDPVIERALDIAGARRLVEVGAEGAIFSAFLAGYAQRNAGDVRCVDPAPSEALRDLARREDGVTLLEEYSPAALDQLQDADAYVLDGDHNWHTVIGELRALRDRITDPERPALVLLHDVQWPCARRDMYYDPSRIPEDERQPYSYESGIAPGNDGLDPHGFRGAGVFAVAEREGGPRNGVLTAVEDFLEETPGLVHRIVPVVFGAGFLYSAAAPWAAALDAYLAPYDRSPLLERMEANRLALYLHVLAIQDELDRRAGVQAQVVGGLRRRIAELEAQVALQTTPS